MHTIHSEYVIQSGIHLPLKLNNTLFHIAKLLKLLSCAVYVCVCVYLCAFYQFIPTTKNHLIHKISKSIARKKEQNTHIIDNDTLINYNFLSVPHNAIRTRQERNKNSESTKHGLYYIRFVLSYMCYSCIRFYMLGVYFLVVVSRHALAIHFIAKSKEMKSYRTNIAALSHS